MSWSQKLDVQKLILSKEKERRDNRRRAGAACFCLLRLWTSITMWALSKRSGGRRGIPAQWNREGDNARLAGVLTCNEVEGYGSGEHS